MRAPPRPRRCGLHAWKNDYGLQGGTQTSQGKIFNPGITPMSLYLLRLTAQGGMSSKKVCRRSRWLQISTIWS